MKDLPKSNTSQVWEADRDERLSRERLCQHKSRIGRASLCALTVLSVIAAIFAIVSTYRTANTTSGQVIEKRHVIVIRNKEIQREFEVPQREFDRININDWWEK